MKSFTVRELVTKLMEYDMADEVFIGLGETAEPSGMAKVHGVIDIQKNTAKGCEFGIYIIPQEHLEVMP